MGLMGRFKDFGFYSECDVFFLSGRVFFCRREIISDAFKGSFWMLCYNRWMQREGDWFTGNLNQPKGK